MKLELFVFGITAFLVVNTYYDGKFMKLFHSWQKEIKMTTFAFVGLSLYIFLKKNPDQSKTMFSHANDIIRYMPISRSSADMLSPFWISPTTSRCFKPTLRRHKERHL